MTSRAATFRHPTPMRPEAPNHALQRTRLGRRSCNRVNRNFGRRTSRPHVDIAELASSVFHKSVQINLDTGSFRLDYACEIETAAISLIP